MKTMYLLLCHCGNHFPPPPFEECVFNHPVVMSCLIWALVVIILSFIVSCYLKKLAQIKKEIAVAAQGHELAMKEKAHEMEKEWFDAKEEKNQNEQIKKLQEEVEMLKSNEKVKELENNLKLKEKEVEILNKQLALYEKTFDNIKVELRTKETE